MENLINKISDKREAKKFLEAFILSPEPPKLTRELAIKMRNNLNLF